MPLRRRLGLLGAGAALMLVGACTGGEKEPAPAAEPSTPGASLSEYTADTVVVEREAFCDGIPESAVEEALGAVPAERTSYGNGEKARVTDDVRDVAHEFDCTYEADDGTVARAWLFAPPVSPAQAHGLVEQARGQQGCRPDEKAPGFGQKSVAVVCDGDGATTASYHGLFGDAWLNCSVEVPPGSTDEQDLLDRAGRWCVQVAEAARA